VRQNLDPRKGLKANRGGGSRKAHANSLRRSLGEKRPRGRGATIGGGKEKEVDREKGRPNKRTKSRPKN